MPPAGATDDEDINILELENTSKASRWRMHYTHRSQARASLDEIVDPPTASPVVEEVLPSTQDDPTAQAAVPSLVSRGVGSRFHITARLSVRDLSLWLSPGKYAYDR